MKKLIYLFVLAMLVSGCANLSQKSDTYLNNLEKRKHSREIIVNNSYEESFKAVIETFHNLSINILKKDYEGQEILGSLYPKRYMNHYGIFFSDAGNNKTRIVLKATGFIINEDVILEKIQEELLLQTKLNK